MIFIRYIQINPNKIVVKFIDIVKRADSGLSMNLFQRDNSFNTINYPYLLNREPSIFPHQSEDYYDIKNYFPGFNKGISGIFQYIYD
jgi:hypothetical protein